MSVESKDLYELLQVHPAADPDIIQAAYRKLASKYHPDKNEGSEEAESMMRAINLAYEVLSDPEQRKAYDAERRGEEPSKAAPEPAPREGASGPVPKSAEPPKTGRRLPRIPGWLAVVGGLGLLVGLNSCNNALADSMGISRWLTMVIGLVVLCGIWAVVVKIAEASEQ